MRDFQIPGRSAVYASNALCATSHPLAAKVAITILEQGGNAADAAIAGAVMLGLCEPQMTGLGGDCFALVKPSGTEQVIALNGSGPAPAALSAAALRDKGLNAVPLRAVSSITMPGAVDAFCRLSQDWGKLGLERILAPAIHYADQGIPVAPRVAADWAEDAGALQGAARAFYLEAGKAPNVGALFRAPKQAEVLRKIAQKGRAGFYEGEVAEDLLMSLHALGGCHSADDLRSVQSTYAEPISGSYQQCEMLEHPPNGQGATAILLLNILKHFDISKMNPLGAERAHIEAEATKLAFDARNRFLADPTPRLEHMLHEATALALAALINPKQAMKSAARLSESIHKDTVYITVVDRDRMAVSLIYSVFWGFGSGFASEKFGILFQNRAAGFNLTEGHPNELAGGKRPMHTIIPGMLSKNGKVIMPFGVMGGAYQPTGHARLVSNLLDFNMDLQSAIDAPRCFSRPEGMMVERGYAPDVLAELAAMGHDVKISPEPIGGAQAIMIDDRGVLVGASDPRKDGCALGY